MNGIFKFLGMGEEIVKARSARKLAEIEAQTRRIERAADSSDGLSALASERSAKSWLDEYWTVALSVPLVLSFIPGMEGYVSAGFNNLQNTPQWWQWSVMASISFAFGRKALPFVGFKKRR